MLRTAVAVALVIVGCRPTSGANPFPGNARSGPRATSAAPGGGSVTAGHPPVDRGPVGFDSGSIVPTHPCARDVALPAATPVRMRVLQLAPRGLSNECPWTTMELRSTSDVERLERSVAPACWSAEARALESIDFARFEVRVIVDRGSPRTVAFFDAPGRRHQVLGEPLCQGIEPEGNATAFVLPRTRDPIDRHTCPTSPCTAP